MNDALRRGIRTFFQTFLGTILTSGVLSAVAEGGLVDWSALKKVGVSALAAAVVALITYAQNALEDRNVIPALLKGSETTPDA